MGEELLEIEQAISKAKVLLNIFYKSTCSEYVKFNIIRICNLLDSYLNRIILLSNEPINHQQIITIINIKKNTEEILKYIEEVLEKW